MASKKITLKNKEGFALSAKLELPATPPIAYAVFAHCFTCTKNLSAVRNIAKTLNLSGFGVLRFDFTGLGDSEGDFSDTNFSSNVEDLIAVSDYLTENYEAPKLLIGHSLGGAAVLFASLEIPSIEAIATIGAPYGPGHVSHLFDQSIEEIEKEGSADVKIGGRPFKVKKQFLEDINSKSIKSTLESVDKALLIFHSPQDMTVTIDNASKMYKAAKHPKSFVSLDKADHLLSNRKDSIYVAEVIASWATRYIKTSQTFDESKGYDFGKVRVILGPTGYASQVSTGEHNFIADEPINIGGDDLGPTPYDLLLSSLGTCSAMTMRMYANRKKWEVAGFEVILTHRKEADPNDPNQKVDIIDRHIKIKGVEDQDKIDRLLQIAEKCPVHKTLSSKTTVITHHLGDDHA